MAKADKAQRRAARKRAKNIRAQGRRGQPWHEPDTGRVRETEPTPPSVDAVAQALMGVAADRLFGADADDVVRSLSSGPFVRWTRLVDTAVARVLRTEVERLWAAGWLPYDLYQVARRQASELAAELVVVAVADAGAQYPAATTHPRWLSQLRELDATPWWHPGSPYPGQWADRHGADRPTMLRTVVELVAVFLRLPQLQVILPLPGQAAGDITATAAGAVDEKVLGRVRALLAKAESTTFAEEAEALSAKAQELMSRYSIERAMAESGARHAPTAAARRIWLDAPYLSAKTLLVAEVGSANHCRTASAEKLGFVTVLGDEVDLDVVEVLTTSLLVQATRAMLAAGSQVSLAGTSRTRSFRHAFLLSYATRIGERLRETADETEAATGTDLVPVFAERKQAVEALFGSLFPRTVERTFSARNAAGWGAGRSAADLAVLKAERRSVTGR